MYIICTYIYIYIHGYVYFSFFYKHYIPYRFQDDYIGMSIYIFTCAHTHIWQSIVGDARCGKVCTVMVHWISELSPITVGLHHCTSCVCVCVQYHDLCKLNLIDTT